jgi:carboxymethylenebutenolidase
MAKAPTEEPPVCYQPTARPPLPPIAGGSGLAGSEQIVLEAEDGNHFSAFTASTDEPGAPGMVILPDVRGLHAFYRDVAATVAHLRSDPGGGARAVYTVGFCFGGRHSFNQAARDIGVAGVIGFYGWPQQRRPDDDSAPVMPASSYRGPVLGLFGGADRGIPTAEVERFRQALDAAGVSNQIVIYEGAPHSFFDRTATEHREASDDAWRRMLSFVGSSA